MRPDRISEIDAVDSSLWLVVKMGARSFAFEFDSSSARIVTVGSAPHSDLKLEELDGAPLVCYFERDGEKLWLVPGYRCKHLRVDTTLVDRPRRLGWRNIVEFPGVILEVRVRAEPPTSPENEIPGASLNPPTAFHRLENEPPISYGKVIAIDEQLDEIEEEVPTLVSVPSSRRLASASIQAPPAKSVEPWEVAARAKSVEPWGAAPPIVSRPILSIGDTSAELVGVTGETRQWDLGTRPAPSWKPTPTFADEGGGEPASMSPSVISLQAARRASGHPLAALGELTRRRPLVVVTGATLGAIVLTLAMSFVSRLTSHKISAKSEGTSMVLVGASAAVPSASSGQRVRTGLLPLTATGNGDPTYPPNHVKP